MLCQHEVGDERGGNENGGMPKNVAVSILFNASNALPAADHIVATEVTYL